MTSGAPLRVGVLISGRGSNLQALIDATAGDAFPATLALVISNNAEAQGLDRAQAAGIETGVIDHRPFDHRPEFEAALTAKLDSAGVELVCLAGFMRLLTAKFVDHWRDRLINIHPSLLPAYKGLDTHRRVLDDGVRITGCTVHFVRAEMDSGPIIIQAAVPVHRDDTEDSLAARVLDTEHQIYPEALRLIGLGAVSVVDDRVSIRDGSRPSAPLFNPPLPA